MLPPPPPPDSLADNRWWLTWGGLGCGLLLAIGNFALYPIDSIFWALWGGVMFGQAGLMAIWLALARPRALVRILAAALAYLVLGGAYFTGYLVREYFKIAFINYDNIEQQLTAILSIPIFIVAAAFPLWLMRLLLGWRIQQDDSPAPHSHQFSIAGLLILTTLIAALLGAGMQACRLVEGEPLEFWLVLGGWCLGTVILSGVTLIPAALLLWRSPLVAIGVLAAIAFGVYVLIVLFVLAMVRSFGGQISWAETWRVIGFVSCPFPGFLLSLVLPLGALRRCGYRLIMGTAAQGA